jgi:hypothetical protein
MAGEKEKKGEGSTLQGSGATYVLTGLNTGSVSMLSGTFAGMVNLVGDGDGTLIVAEGTAEFTGPGTGTATLLSGTFSGMANLRDGAPQDASDKDKVRK